MCQALTELNITFFGISPCQPIDSDLSDTFTSNSEAAAPNKNQVQRARSSSASDVSSDLSTASTALTEPDSPPSPTPSTADDGASKSASENTSAIGPAAAPRGQVDSSSSGAPLPSSDGPVSSTSEITAQSTERPKDPFGTTLTRQNGSGSRSSRSAGKKKSTGLADPNRVHLPEDFPLEHAPAALASRVGINADQLTLADPERLVDYGLVAAGAPDGSPPFFGCVWWESAPPGEDVIEDTIPYLEIWIRETIRRDFGLEPSQYSLELTIAISSATVMHSRVPYHKKLPYRYSYHRFMAQLLPHVDYLFTIGERALGFNPYGLYVDLLPLMKPGSKLHIVRAGGSLPSLRLDPKALSNALERRLVDEGIVADPVTQQKKAPKTLLELVTIYTKPTSNASDEAENLIGGIFTSYIGRCLISLGKNMSNLDGMARRFPELLALEEPAEMLDDRGHLRQLRVKGTHYGRPCTGDDDASPLLEEEAVSPQPGPSRPGPSRPGPSAPTLNPTPDLVRQAYRIDLAGDPSCRTPGCDEAWTYAQFRLCDRCELNRRLSVAPLNAAQQQRRPPPPPPPPSFPPPSANTPPERGNFRCKICAITYVKKESLDRHLATHPQGNVFECPVCSDKFAYRPSLDKHVKDQHPNHWRAERTCTVKGCNRFYENLGSLNAHKNWHRDYDASKSRICTTCELLFSNAGVRRKHMQTQHPGTTATTQPLASTKRKATTASTAGEDDQGSGGKRRKRGTN